MFDKKSFAAIFRMFLTTAVLCFAVSVFAVEPLWSNHRAQWAVVRSKDAGVVVDYAASEIKTALDACSGGDFEILDRIPAGRSSIIIGSMNDFLIKPAAEKLGLVEDDNERVVIRMTKNGQLIIAGNSPKAALDASYHFLRKYIGVRYLWPGEEGTFYPKTASKQLPENIEWSYSPKIRWRGFHLCGEWYRAQDYREWMCRNSMNIHCHPGWSQPEQLGLVADGGGHILALYGREDFEQHPEWFALLNGSRCNKNLCFSNRNAAKAVTDKLDKWLSHTHSDLLYYNMFAADNIEFCECPECAKRSNSSNLFQFHQWVASALKMKHPEVRFAGLAYSEYLQPPQIRLDICDMIQIATHNKCNHHLIGDKSCPWNVKLTQLFQNWRLYREKNHYGNKMIFGEYGYEFDIYLDKGIAQFTPLFTLIEDSVRTAVKYDHTLVIPEIPLSPAAGPPIEVGAYVNRLPLAYYALAMWDPSLSADEYLRDTAKTIWGPAWEPMYKYFVLLDRAWRGVRSHTLILKNPLSVAGQFLRPETDRTARQRLAEAARLLADANADTARLEFPAFDPKRAKEALDFEKALLGRWEGYSGVQRGERPRLALPTCISGKPDCESKRLVKADGKPSNYSVKCGWNPDTREIIVYWEGLDKKMPKANLHADVTLIPGTDGTRFVFTSHGDGIKSAVRLFANGASGGGWNPDWSVEVTDASMLMRIPMDEISAGLDVNKSISVIFTAGLKEGENDAFYPESSVDNGAILEFSRHYASDKPAAIWLGCPSREKGLKNQIVDDAARHGWKAVVTDDDAEFREALKDAKLIWIRHCEHENRLSSTAWKMIRRKVRQDGAVLGCSSLWPMPIDKCLGDDSFALKWVNLESQPAGARKFESVADGSWGTAVYPIATTLRNGISACYAFEPVKRKKWDILATQFNVSGRPPVPCIMSRKFGVGDVVVFGLANSLDCFGLLTNIFQGRE